VTSRGKSEWFVGVVLLLVMVIAGYEFHARLSGASASAPQPETTAQKNLRQFMQSRVHEEYTRMSFTIWHDQPLTSQKMDMIGASAGRIAGLTHELQSYEAVYRQQGWGPEDVQYFENKRVQLNRVAEELKKAAQKHDSSEVTSLFMNLDSTCQSCHHRFRPDLAWD